MWAGSGPDAHPELCGLLGTPVLPLALRKGSQPPSLRTLVSLFENE